ncbi:MAG: L-dopachrome tautomerase-related protein, partial [Waterburya sp.]
MFEKKLFLKGSIAFLVLVTPLTLITQKLIASPNNIQTQSTSVSQTPQVGQLEVVSELNITPGNVTASKDGRIFASVHGMRRGSAQLI